MSQEDSKARSRTFFLARGVERLTPLGKGVKLKELFSTPEEFHAFLIGFFEVLCPWPPRHSINPTNSTNSEYHYYLGGRAMAVLAWLAIAKLIQVIFW